MAVRVRNCGSGLIDYILSLCVQIVIALSHHSSALTASGPETSVSVLFLTLYFCH